MAMLLTGSAARHAERVPVRGRGVVAVGGDHAEQVGVDLGPEVRQRDVLDRREVGRADPEPERGAVYGRRGVKPDPFGIRYSPAPVSTERSGPVSPSNLMSAIGRDDRSR